MPGISSAKIEQLTFEETYNLWINARRYFDSPKMGLEARRIKEAVEAVWKARHASHGRSWFKWPSLKTKRSGDRFTEALREIGILRFYGYSVSNEEGLSSKERRQILDEIFSSKLAWAFDSYYLSRWSELQSPERLRQMAVTIANLIYLAENREDENMASAARKWRADMEYLHNKYYVGKFLFDWPDPDWMIAPHP